MNKWSIYSQAIYYTGVGVVLLGTGIRYLYRKFKERDEEAEFVEELRTVHLPYIYESLSRIAQKLDVRLEAAPRL